MPQETANFLFALFTGSVFGWVLRGFLADVNRSIRNKVRSKI
jgi:hypothetical protein